jgi:RNA-directed DNA polymerase
MNMGHVMEQPSPGDCLLEKILSRHNLIAAWKRVKANGGAPGIDGLTIEEFPAATRRHWHEILESLMAGTYQPSAVRRNRWLQIQGLLSVQELWVKIHYPATAR